MKMFLITDNADTCTGMRLAGIEGVIVKNRVEFEQAFDGALTDPDIGILLVMEDFSKQYPEKIDEVRMNRRTPLIVEIPDPRGTGRNPNFITDYVGEAIGLKL